MSDDPNVRRVAEALTKRLAGEGQLLAAGWQTYRLLCLKRPVSDPCDDLAEAFWAGCEHTFASIMNMLDPGQDETEADLQRMDRLHAELEPVRAAMKLKYGRTAGSA